MCIRRPLLSEFRLSPKTCGLIIAPLFCIFVAYAWGQEQFRVNVRLVNVAFSAHDSRGVPVENLSKEDVEVFEDAVPQKVSFFAHSMDVPLTLGLIVDFSGSQDQFTKRHERDLQVFLKDVLGPKDRVFLVFRESRPVGQRLCPVWRANPGTTRHLPGQRGTFS